MHARWRPLRAHSARPAQVRLEPRVEPPRPPLAPVAHSRQSLQSSSPALAVHVQQRRLRAEGIAKWAVHLGVRRAQSGVSVVPGTAATGGAVLGRSERLSDMAERTCAEPPGTHPREGASNGDLWQPSGDLLLLSVNSPDLHTDIILYYQRSARALVHLCSAFVFFL